MDLDSVAGQLYALPPEEFTSARDARAAEARSSGDRELSASIKKLRRPTAGAWLANLLARERPEQVVGLVDLGAEMRRAQADLVGDELRRLSQRRRQVVAALGDDARRLGRDRGRPVSEASARELEATLEAALADPGAADALRQGRLTTALHYSGFAAAGLTPAGDGAAGPAGGTVSGPARRRRPPAAGRTPTAGRSRERIQAARQELRAAEATAASTEREAARQERQLRDARTEHDRIARQLASLERRLRDLREAADQAARDLGDAERAREAASSDARDARDRVSQARKALDRLTEAGG